MTIKPGEWRPLSEMLKRVYPHQTPTAAAKLILMQVSNNTDLEAQVLSDAYSCLAGLSEAKIPSPSPAGARSDTKVVVDLEEATTDPVSEIAVLFTGLDWRDAVLPQRLTPAVYAAQLLEMFPDKNLPQQIKRAQIWHLDRKPSWKRLAHALNGWLAKPTPEWEKESQRSTFKGPTNQSNFQDYTPETGRTDGNDF